MERAVERGAAHRAVGKLRQDVEKAWQCGRVKESIDELDGRRIVLRHGGRHELLRHDGERVHSR